MAPPGVTRMHSQRVTSEARSPFSLLCVDDNHDIVTMLLKCFATEDNVSRVTGAHSADEFLAALHDTPPDIAIVDLTMPGDTEPIEAIRIAAQQFPRTRVLAYSGFDDREIRDQVMDAGGWGFVSKHSELPVLLKAVRSVASGTPAF